MAVSVFVSPGVEALRVFALGLGVAAALVVLIAHLARPKVQRCLAACLLVFLFVGIARVALRADDGDFVITDPCKGLTPSDWEYWAYGCFWPV
jgi:hypothetical protein